MSNSGFLGKPGGGGTSNLTFITDTGTAVSSAGIINLNGSNNITTAGASNTVILNFNLPPNTENNVLIVSDSNIITTVPPSSNAGIALISQGSSSYPIFGTLLPIGGGTGLTSTVPYALLAGGTSSSGNFQQISGLGSSGQLLTSSGNGSLPTWQNAPVSGIVTIDGNSGSVTGSTVTFETANSTAIFSGSSSTMKMDFAATNNLVLGTTLSSLTSGSYCVGIGYGALFGISSQTLSVAIGHASMNQGVGSYCTAIGAEALYQCTGSQNSALGAGSGFALTSGTNNTLIGYAALNSLTTGGNNTVVGSLSGTAYTSSEANNIILGYDIAGTIAESNVIRIGNSSNTSCYITGIEGVSVSDLNVVTINTSTSQLGSVAQVGVGSGGTGNSTFTAYSVLCAGTTSTGEFQNVSGLGSSNYVLTSNGANALPTWQVIPTTIATIDGNSGSVTGATVTFETANSTAIFSGSSSTMKMDFAATNNLVLGTTLSSLTSGSYCVGIGYGALFGISSQTLSVAIGHASMNQGVGSYCTAIGAEALYQCTGSQNSALGAGSGFALTSGTNNTLIGYAALNSLTTGGNNTVVGCTSGSAYTSSEGNNLILGYNIAGTAAESNVIRIGNSSNTSCYITGIEGVSVSNLNVVTVNTSTSQLGSVATVGLANGGTNADLTASNGGIFYSTASAGAILSGTSTADQILMSGASTTPAWSTATYPTTASAGNIIYASATNTYGNIATSSISGTNLVIDDAGLPVWNKVSSSVDILSFQDDFINYNGGGGVGGIWFTTTNNTSTQAVRTNYNNLEIGNHPGTWSFVTGTTDADQIGITTLGYSTNYGQGTGVVLGGGEHILTFVLLIPQLSNGTDNFNLTFGFGDLYGSYEASYPPPNSVFFQYNYSTSTTYWLYGAGENGTLTTNTSSVAVNTNWNVFQIVVNAAATSVNYLINGTSIGTCTTNIPTTSSYPVGIGLMMQKTLGTNVVFSTLDYFSWYHRLTTPRF